jgi:hypothetical protein
MTRVKKSNTQQTQINIKEIYIMAIIFILLTSVFPPAPNAETSLSGTYLTIGTATATPDLHVEGNMISISTTREPTQTISEENNNNKYYQNTSSVTPWWNINWHYRRIYNVTGSGNISLQMNFTETLASLQVFNKTFDNASIAIIQYHTNGTMMVVNKTLFNESSVFHNKTNAVGTLLWNVTESSIYGVYFDVIENSGTRIPMSETLTLTQSGSVHASEISTQGWWPTFSTSFHTYYPLNTTLTIRVYTTALAKNMTAHFLWEGQPQFNISFTTFDNLYWFCITKKLSKIGNWTLRVIGYDDAGYQTPPITTNFYIGQPDLVVSALTMPSVCYIGYNATITGKILAVNTTVENVNVSLFIDNVINATQKNLTIQKDQNKTIEFSWKPSKKGNHNISIRISYNDSNPWNNERWKEVTVEGIPDMAVLNISVAPIPVLEGTPVTVTAHIHNKGAGNATDYEVVLYCEQNENNKTMNYIDKRNSTKISLKRNEYKNVTITWENTRYGKTGFKGEWAVGIQIPNTTQTPDKNDTNNKKALFHVLRVIPAERNPPVLSNLEYPETQEQGKQVLIRVKATDQSGIGTISISIQTTNKTFVNATMTPRPNDRYDYLFDAIQLGKHTFIIKAIDRSPFKNQSAINGSFTVTGDKTPPTITYSGVNPFVQLPNRLVEFRCIATDFSGIQSAQVTIRFPDNRSVIHPMSTNPPDTKYVYAATYEQIGKYIFTITAQDTQGNNKTTEEKTFWITNDLNDTDSDGMPDAWELRYGLDPYDPTDAFLDADNDGVTNLQEYLQGTNPLKKESSSASIIQRLQQNGAYLVTSILVFAGIVVLAWYGMRRKKP